jgi:cytochrome P450
MNSNLFFVYHNFYSLPPIKNLILTVLILAVLIYKLCFKKKNRIGPQGYPIIGNAFDIMRNKYLSAIPRYRETYGDCYTLNAFTQNFVVLSNAKLCKEVLSKRPTIFHRKTEFIKPLIEKLGFSDGLPFSDGDVWKAVRKIAAPCFSNKNFMDMIVGVSIEVKHLIERLSLTADGNNVFDMKKEIQCYAVRVISAVGFGGKTDNKYNHYFFSDAFRVDLEQQLAYFSEKAFFPFPDFVWNMYPALKKVETVAIEKKNVFIENCEKLINYEINKANNNEQVDNNNYLLKALLKNSIEEKQETNKNGTSNHLSVKLNKRILLENMRSFYIAGSETTSISITWCLFFLATATEEFIEKIRSEVDVFFENKKELSFLKTTDDDDSNHNDNKNNNNNNNNNEIKNDNVEIPKNDIIYDIVAHNMNFTTACYKEALRMAPPFPFLVFKSTVNNVELSNKFKILIDDTVLLSIDNVLNDKSVFENPNVYNPNRWLTNDEAKLRLMEESFLVFGFGPRVCPGFFFYLFFV